jgi:hypothetical protein
MTDCNYSPCPLCHCEPEAKQSPSLALEIASGYALAMTYQEGK